MKNFMKFLFVFIQFQSIFMDIEYLNSIHQGLGIDPSLIKNIAAADENKRNKLCSADPESIWIYVQKEIDTNQDEKIDMTEFRDSISKQIKKTQRKELDGLYKNLDPKETGSITFHAYINDALGDSYDMDELEKSTADSSHDLHDVRVFYQTEKKKWYFITKGQDEMSREQFAAFIFSEDHQHIIDFENEMIFKLYDKNNDGFWSFDEYMQTVKHYEDSIVNLKKKQFLPIADLNGDNNLDLNEFKTWDSNNVKERLYREEDEFVFMPCDSDKDSILNKTEVIMCCDKFMKSHLTDFGDELGSPYHVKDEL